MFLINSPIPRALGTGTSQPATPQQNYFLKMLTNVRIENYINYQTPSKILTKLSVVNSTSPDF